MWCIILRTNGQAMNTATPILGDGDGDDDDQEIEFVPASDTDIATWTDEPDEKRRAFLISTIVTADVDANIMVKNLDVYFQWMKTGDLPHKEKSTKLRAVPKVENDS